MGSIYLATPTGFRVYIRFSNGAALTPAYANTRQWHIHWQGRQEIISKYYRFGGQLIAMHKGPALQYLHTDRLPSRRAASPKSPTRVAATSPSRPTTSEPALSLSNGARSSMRLD